MSSVGYIQGLGGKGGYPPNWSELGYSDTPTEIITAFNYAKNLKDTWTGVRNLNGVKDLYFFPDVNMKESRGYGGMFQNSNLMHIPPIVFGQTTPTGNVAAYDMFRGTYIENISLTAANNTQTFDLQRTFYDCILLKTATINVKASNIGSMFYNCKKLTSIAGSFDTSEVTNFGESFRGCNVLATIPTLNTSSVTSFYRTFVDCWAMVDAPNWDFQNAQDLSQIFWNCTGLRNVPLYSIPKATNLTNMFQGTGSNLTETSRDNILQMCISATAYTGIKTLARLAFNASMYTAASWQALPHYTDFTTAGWTIGY